MHIKGEVVTAREALRRVGLEDLATDREDRWLVEWTGTPRPFACGHTAVYGYGPLNGYHDPAEEAESAKLNDRKGSHRIYQSLHRVSQHFASGPVLFAWGAVGTSYPNGDRTKAPSHFRLNSGLVVSIVELADDKSTALRIGWTA